MNINYKQPQFELFPANSATLEDVKKPGFLLAYLTLSIESLVIFSILAIMVALFSFSLGVEQGKRLTAQAMDEHVAKAWNVGTRKAIPVVAKPMAAVAPAVALPSKMSVNNAALSLKSKPAMSSVAVSKPAIPVASHFTLQAATYGNEEYAKQEALGLKAKGFQTFLIRSGQYWLVCVGNFNSKENAIAFSSKLPAKFRGSQVRRF